MSPLRRSMLAAAACALALAAAAPAHADPNGDLVIADATPLDYGTISVGTSLTKKVTLKNSGVESASISNVSFTGPDADEFSVDTSPCAQVVGASSSCDLNVNFNPTRAGAASATLVVDADGLTPQSTLSLGGTGAARELQLSPAAVDFGTVRVNDCCSSQWIQIQNVGQADVPVDSAWIDGPDSFAFWVNNNSCNFALAPGNTCSVEIRFAPNEGRQYDATFHAWSGPAEFTSSLTGLGGVSTATLSPSVVEFGDVEVGKWATQTITMTSTGNQPFAAFVDILNGGDVGQFRLMTDGCALVFMNPGEQCTMTVRFQPIEAGSYEARLTSLGDGDPKIATVRGTGVAPPRGATGSTGTGGSDAAPAPEPEADAPAPARIAFDTRGPARVYDGWAYLGRARCNGAPRCRVTVHSQYVVTFDGKARPYLVRGRTRTWTVTSGQRVLVPMPRSLKADPGRVLLTLEVQAAGHPTGVQYRSVRLVPGR